MRASTLLTTALFFTVSFNVMASGDDVPTAYDYDKIKVKEGVKLVNGKLNDIESPALSNDGNQICWIGKKSKSKFVFPTDIFMVKKGANGWSSAKKHKKGARQLNVFSKCAFDHKHRLQTSELSYRPGAIIRSLIDSRKRGDFTPRGYVSIITTYKGKKRIQKIKPKHLGHRRNMEFLKHPRTSPDGKWITYYTMGLFEKKRGVYLYNKETKKNYHLSDTPDKHPTWSPDGKRILFHHSPEIKKGEIEQAYLGYFDVKISGDKVLWARRVLMDNPKAEGFTFHKHPAIYPGTDLLFFHGEKKPDGKKRIFVRRMRPFSKITEIKMTRSDGMKLKKAKHPTTAMVRGKGMVFVGKQDVKGSKYEVYELTHQKIMDLNNEIQ